MQQQLVAAGDYAGGGLGRQQLEWRVE